MTPTNRITLDGKVWIVVKRCRTWKQAKAAAESHQGGRYRQHGGRWLALRPTTSMGMDPERGGTEVGQHGRT